MDFQVISGKKCPFYDRSSSKYSKMECRHYHSGREWIEFIDRNKMREWKNAFCYGDFKNCKYFPENIGRDTTFEDVWIVVVTYQGREYWKRAVSAWAIVKATSEIILEIVRVDPDSPLTKLDILVRALHSSDPGFNDFLSDVQFSGDRLDDAYDYWNNE
jgi:hypothetical protein